MDTKMNVKSKKPFYRKWWFILIVLIVIFSVIGSIKSGLKNAAAKNETYTWPESTLSGMIPQPESKYGKINMENEDYISIDVYKTSKESFEKYIEACKSKGFTVDYSKYDDFYSADTEDGYSLRLTFDEKEKTMDISLNAPAKEISSAIEESENENAYEIEESENTEEPSDINNEENEGDNSQNTAETSDQIRPEFKEALDNYEAFMDEYCEFMKKYAESDNDISMLSDYTQIMTKYAEFAEKIQAMDEEEMNDAEAKYYLEVTLRVEKKLLETGFSN